MKSVKLWASRWVVVSLIVDILLIMLVGWTDFIATGWWKSFPMAALIILVWRLGAYVLGKAAKDESSARYRT